MVLARDDPSWVEQTPETADHILLERFYQQRFNSIENAYYHHLSDNLDPGLWAGWEGWITSLVEDPLMAHFWAVYRDGYMPELIQFMDARLGQGSPP